MAEKQSPRTKSGKKTQTVRERAAKAQEAKPKRRIKQTAGVVASPLKKAHSLGKKEYHLPLPNNKMGRFLGKRGRLTPKFFSEAWAEIRQVTWPTRQETLRLTMAVFIFSIVFAVFVGLLDFGLDKLFREVLLKSK